MDNIPDRWVILKITRDEETTFKVLGSWFGDYMSGQSWKTNSGIVSVVDHGPTLTFEGKSGSIYLCNKEYYGMHSLSADVVEGLQTKYDVTVLEEEEAMSLDWCRPNIKVIHV